MPEEEPSQGSTSFNEKSFEDFRNTIGPDRVNQWLGRLDEQLKNTFAGEGLIEMDRQRIAANAHAIIPQAALLGFSDLSELCTALEQACLKGDDLSKPLERVCKAARRARETVARVSGMAPA
jgi:HPt (histidine-containing phosphotransfer) domain-containing protein